MAPSGLADELDKALTLAMADQLGDIADNADADVASFLRRVAGRMADRVA